MKSRRIGSRLGVYEAVMLAVFAAIVLFLAIGLAGCSSIGELFKPKNVVTPPYAKAEHRRATSQPSGRKTFDEWFVEAWGPGMKGPDMKEITPSPLEITPEGGLNVGRSGVKLGAFAGVGNDMTAVYIVGLLLIVVGGIVAYKVSWQLGAFLIGGALVGVGAIQFMNTYPWVLWLVGVLGVIFAGYLVWKFAKAGKLGTTGTVIVKSVEELETRMLAWLQTHKDATPEDVAKAASAVLKETIADNAGADAAVVKSTVTEIKSQ